MGKCCFFITVVTLSLFVCMPAFGVAELWEAGYSGRVEGGDDRAAASAVDDSGNVYITGLGAADYTTVKCSSSGNLLWVSRFNFPGSGAGQPRAIAVDPSGNVYVTGTSSGGGNWPVGYATVKYDSEGRELWARYYRGPGNGTGDAYALALDSAGNIYVTGGSRGLNGYLDYATVKYDSSGNELWTVRYDGSAGRDDIACALALDSASNLYVTGYSKTGKSYDYTTVKYDSSGNQLWAALYDGPSSADDKPCGLAVDSQGNVCVAGSSNGGGDFGTDYATVKYDTSGSQLWVARYNGPGNGSDDASSIAVDAAGNTYVTGSSKGSQYGEYATISYDPAGNQRWAARYCMLDTKYPSAYARDLALDHSGFVYVTGYSAGAGYATVKYDLTGNQVWAATCSGTQDSAQSVNVDQSARLLLCGAAYHGSRDYQVVTYDQSGNRLWGMVYDGRGRGEDRATAAATEASGCVYVAGYSEGDGTTYDFATVKYDPDGVQLWAARYNSEANGDDESTGLAVDVLGNVCVTGYAAGGSTGWDFTTIKYDSAGNQLWLARYNGTWNGDDYATAVAVDSSGNVYITGCAVVSSNRSFDYVTIKYDASGNELWSRVYDGPGNGDDIPWAIAVDGSGNVCVTGYSYGGSSVGTDFATIKYDPEGNTLWVARYNGPGNADDGANALAVDADGNVCVTGYSFGGATVGMDLTTIKYDLTGNALWVGRYGGPGDRDDRANGIAIGPSNSVYVTGYSYAGTASSHDYTTIKYDADGTQLWLASYDGPLHKGDWASSIAVDASGGALVTGSSTMGDPGHPLTGYATINYDSNGNELWVDLDLGLGSSEGKANTIVVDPLGYFYMVGTRYSVRTGSDYVTVKYDPHHPVCSLVINGGDIYTATTEVVLSITAAALTPISMRFSNDGRTWSSWQPFADTRIWRLEGGGGPTTVYGQFTDAEGRYNAPVSASIMLANPLMLSQAKAAATGVWVAVKDCAVTAKFPSCVYVEDFDRTAGVKITPAPADVSIGSIIELMGTIGVAYDEKRISLLTYKILPGSRTIQPLAMPNKSLGGGDWMYDKSTGAGQVGVWGWEWVQEYEYWGYTDWFQSKGLNNVGLLVTSLGVVTEIEKATPPSLPDWFRMTDGSDGERRNDGYDANVKVFLPPGVIAPAPGSFVTVTGISAIDIFESYPVRAIRVRQQSDIQP